METIHEAKTRGIHIDHVNTNEESQRERTFQRSDDHVGQILLFLESTRSRTCGCNYRIEGPARRPGGWHEHDRVHPCTTRTGVVQLQLVYLVRPRAEE